MCAPSADTGMTMDREFIERLIGILERSTLSELEYSEQGVGIRLSRSAPSRTAEITSAQGVPVQEAEAPSVVGPTATAKPMDGQKRSAGTSVTAPLSGTFYRSSSPGQPPLVQIGDLVLVGQQLAIIEAMKMLNSVEAECAGRIVRILPEDGASVQVDSDLFVIEPVEETNV